MSSLFDQLNKLRDANCKFTVAIPGRGRFPGQFLVNWWRIRVGSSVGAHLVYRQGPFLLNLVIPPDATIYLGLVP